MFSFFVPNSETVIRFRSGFAEIEDRGHPYIVRSSRYSVSSGSGGSTLSDYGLTRELSGGYDADGPRFERSYKEYSYYDESGDLVGVKTVWGDGRESDAIFSGHEDEYAELP